MNQQPTNPKEPAMTEPLDLLSLGDVAELAGVNRTTIDYHVKRNRLPVAGILPNGTRLFRRADAERFVHLTFVGGQS